MLSLQVSVIRGRSKAIRGSIIMAKSKGGEGVIIFFLFALLAVAILVLLTDGDGPWGLS